MGNPEGGPGPELEKDKPYYLDKEDFAIEKAPREPVTHFQPDTDKVTRENFMAMFVLSVGVSRGQLPVQEVFLRWMKARHNFDHVISFLSCVQKAMEMHKTKELRNPEIVADCFSDEEMGYAVDQVKAVPLHGRVERLTGEEHGRLSDFLPDKEIRDKVAVEMGQVILDSVFPNTEWRENRWKVYGEVLQPETLFARYDVSSVETFRELKPILNQMVAECHAVSGTLSRER